MKIALLLSACTLPLLAAQSPKLDLKRAAYGIEGSTPMERAILNPTVNPFISIATHDFEAERLVKTYNMDPAQAASMSAQRRSSSSLGLIEEVADVARQVIAHELTPEQSVHVEEIKAHASEAQSYSKEKVACYMMVSSITTAIVSIGSVLIYHYSHCSTN